MSTLITILVNQYTTVDLMIENYYYDAITHQFPWKNTWFAKDLMHGYVKYVISDVGRLLWIVVLLDFIYPWRIISEWMRLRLRFLTIASIIIATLVPLLKSFSVLHCPWDISRYGGYAPYLRLFDAVPSGLQPGHCFPAGHANVGLWLAALCVFWLPHKPRTALTIFFSGLGVGFALGWVQQMRGAHFLFHTLWSMLLTTLVVVVMLSLTKKIND